MRARSYVHSVTALAGADLIKLTGNPLYSPLTPSAAKMVLIPFSAPVYTGMSEYA